MKREQGYTLLEMMLVLVMLVPIVGLVLTSSQHASRNMAADDLVAKNMEALQRAAVRISQIARPCSLTTYRMQATPPDVAAGRATVVGEWIEPVDGEARQGIRFRCATGTLSMNANGLTPWRTFRFQLEGTEVANGTDDDGDGLVDEGQVMLDYDGTSVVLVNHVERANFTLSVRTLQIELRTAARRQDGKVQRFTIRETLYLRNN